jgi:hypothetical protein
MHCDDRLSDDAQSYFVFYAIWCYAMLTNLEHADVVISIDQLSTSAEYRARTVSRLAELGVSGIDFANCNVFRGYFGGDDEHFFRTIEERVHRIFCAHGYAEDAVERVAALGRDGIRPANLESGSTSAEADLLAKELSRLRSLARRLSSDRADLRKTRIALREEYAKVAKLEARLQSIYDSVPWKAILPFAKVYWKVRSIYRARRK